MDTTEGADAPYRLAVPAHVEAGLAALANMFDGDVDRVWLAAAAKVAAMVVGSPTLRPGRQTWRDLVAGLETPQARAEARRAWQGVQAQTSVDAGRVSGYLREALRRLATAPDEPHRATTLLPAAEVRAQLAMSSGPARPLPARRVHELFEERAARQPDALAACAGARRWTYRELNANANRVAWSLRDGGLAAGEVVAVVAERTLEWFAAVLGVFKAAGCYLPIEPSLPPDRVTGMLARSGCRWMLAERGSAPLVATVGSQPSRRLSYLDDVLTAAGSTADPHRAVAGAQRAYMFFTSGSTGEPKAATCTHDGFLNHLLAKIEDFDLAEGQSIAQTSPQCFDISLWQLVSALLIGGSTHLIGQDVVVDADRFLDTLQDTGIEVVQLVPSYLEVMLSAQETRPRSLPRLRRMSVTGEALKRRLVQRWFAAFPGVPLVNAYGLTETSDDTNHEVMSGPVEQGRVPIGRPVRNTRVLVVDEGLGLVPTGAPGELVISGVCVGEGYANDPARTATAFVADPYRPGRRLYRSGDYGRWLPSGSLDYLGRRDSQVKLHGQRLEIGEIENALSRLAVRDAVVLVAGQADRSRLVAFYSDTSAPAPDEARAVLAAALPAYMVPSELHRLAALPLTPNGKVDRNRLLRLVDGGTEPAGEGHEEPVTGSERRVARLWAELLKVPLERIGRRSRFTELGGTSLAAIRVAIGMDRLISLDELHRAGTVAEVAALLDSKTAAHDASGT